VVRTHSFSLTWSSYNPLLSDTPETGPNERLNTPWSSATLSSQHMASTKSPTATSSPSSKSNGSSNVGAVAGGVVGSVIAISAAAFIVFLRKRRKHRKGLPTKAVFDPIPLPLMDEFRPLSSDGGTFVPPSLPEMCDQPVRLYVRVYCRPAHVLMSPLFSICAGPGRPNHALLEPRS
jgi:hypothetical protein